MTPPTGYPRPERLIDVITLKRDQGQMYTLDQLRTARYVLACLQSDVDMTRAPILWRTFGVLLDALDDEIRATDDGAA